MEIVESKLCPRCNQLLPRSAFARDKYRKDGLTAFCMPCRKKRVGRQRMDFTGVTKQCAVCARSLSADRFKYNKLSDDHLHGRCLTCDAWKDRKTVPTLSQVRLYEAFVEHLVALLLSEMGEQYHKEFAQVVAEHRSELEQRFATRFESSALAQDWKMPRWVHFTSLC